jgi:hypothetical protein
LKSEAEKAPSSPKKRHIWVLIAVLCRNDRGVYLADTVYIKGGDRASETLEKKAIYTLTGAQRTGMPLAWSFHVSFIAERFK